MLSAFSRATRTTAPYHIGITGHRNLGNAATFRFVSRSLHTLLADAQHRHTEGIVALFGMAEGTDTLFGQIALNLNIPLIAVIPYAGFIDDFPTGSLRQQYQHLVTRCEMVYTLPFATRSDEAYMAAGCWLADHSDLLLAVWNGQPAAGRGGTGDVVAYTQCIGRPIIHIHTVEHTLRSLPYAG